MLIAYLALRWRIKKEIAFRKEAIGFRSTSSNFKGAPASIKEDTRICLLAMILLHKISKVCMCMTVSIQNLETILLYEKVWKVTDGA